MHRFERVPDRELWAYVLGSLRDATFSRSHRTWRIGQADPGWLEVLSRILTKLGHRSWIYREGVRRRFWVPETTAVPPFADREVLGLEANVRLAYVRGFFDADGGMPRDPGARLYLQFAQKDRAALERVHAVLEPAGISCGSIHNPSVRADNEYWRFFVRARSHLRFMRQVGSWHPRKASLMRQRMERRSLDT